MKRFYGVLLTFCLIVGLCGCGKTISEVMPSKEATSGSGADNTNTDSKDLLGSWVLIGTLSEGKFFPIEYDSYYGDLYEESTIEIYELNKKMKLDYYYKAYESYSEYEGLTLDIIQADCGKDVENHIWYANVSRRKPRENPSDIVVLEDHDTLIKCTSYTYTYEDETTTYDNYMVYTRSENDIQASVEKLLYKDTIEVSNVEELYNALGSNRRIVLNEGVYNFSELTDSQKHNENVNTEQEYMNRYYSQEAACVMNATNLLIEAKEGANVEICTNDYSAHPIAFYNGSRICLRNLTIGHHVEPGMCAGGVVGLWNCYKVTIDSCKLYGSGTDGIDGDCTSSVYVNDCEIYECTYSYVYGYYCGNFNFNNCTFRDTTGSSMIDLWDCWDFTFTNCEFKNSTQAYGDVPFVGGTEGAVFFYDCNFENNEYPRFIDYGYAYLDNCTIDGTSYNGRFEDGEFVNSEN